MDYESVPVEDFGKSLRGIGLNLLVRDVRATSAFLKAVFDLGVHRLSDDFAIITYGTEVFQLHSDGTYSENPLLNVVPENPPRALVSRSGFMRRTRTKPLPGLKLWRP